MNILGGQLDDDFTPVLSNTKSSIAEWMLYVLLSSGIIDVLALLNFVVFLTIACPGGLFHTGFVVEVFASWKFSFRFSATQGTKGLGFSSLVRPNASGDASVLVTNDNKRITLW